MVANNGATIEATKYKWSSSYDAIATVDKKGLVTFADDLSADSVNEVFIYAEDKESGIIGVYYFNSKEQNETPVPAQVKSLKVYKSEKTSITLKWEKVTGANGYYV